MLNVKCKDTMTDVMDKIGIDAVLITDPYSLRYYTGFRGGEGIAVVTRQSAVLITDSRYTEAAEAESDFTVREYGRGVSELDIVMEVLDKDLAQLVGMESESISYILYKKLSERLPGRLRELGDLLMIPRQIKTPEEIELLEHAEHIGDMAFSDMLNILKPGMTELEVAAEIEYSMKKHGAEGLSFDTIAASGKNSSMPHAIPSEKKLESGDFLTMDFGCIYKGYCSDMTRTVCIGKATDEMKTVYNTVLEAQLKVLDELRPGMQCCEVDAIARDYIAEKGYGDYFGHGLGHGVGLYIHESPAFNMRDESIVRPNMIETDEPGIYLPGKFGVRIEDMILITEDGCRTLAQSPKELIEL